MSEEQRRLVRELAATVHENGVIELDDVPALSVGADGVWVQAWVFVDDDTLAQHGIDKQQLAEEQEGVGCA